MNRYDTLLLAGGTSESRRTLRSILGESYNLLETATARQTLMLLEQNRDCVAAVLLDVTNPDALDRDMLTGPEGRAQLSSFPVIVLTVDDAPETLETCFDLGAADVIPLDYDPYAMLRRIETLIQLHLHRQNLEGMVREQAIQLRQSNEAMVDALSSIIEYRSVESGQHILRLRQFTHTMLEQVALVCPEYGLTEDVITIISSAAALHDVGKIGISDAILTKPGPLTAQERETMKTHSLIGCRILESMGDVADREYLRYAHNICHYHHERWDGGGYPEGLSGEEIPICAQVVGLMDVYDALTSKRVYKDAIDRTTAANMIINGECGVFSDKLLECFKQCLPRLEELSQAYADGLSPNTERFEVALPEPEAIPAEDSIQILEGKYQCLLHYLNALVLELYVDRGYFHLRYNPYPELGMISRASDFGELKRIVLEHIVTREDRQRMEELFDDGILDFLRAGMRRWTFRFSLLDRNGQPEPYDITLLRAKTNQAGPRTLAVLCKKAAVGQLAPRNRQPDFAAVMAGSCFCCRNDRYLTLERYAEGLAALSGYTVSQLRSQFAGRLIQLVHPQDRQSLVDTLRSQLRADSRVQAEFRILPRNQQYVWVMFEGRLVMDPDGQECLYCYMTDVSDTRRAYESLKNRIGRYEIILAQTENALFDWNLEEDTISFSDTWRTIFGMTPISGNVRNALREYHILYPDDIPRLFDGIRLLESGSSYETMELRIAGKNGRYMWCRIRASAIRDENAVLQRIVGLIINIDTEKQAERALQERAERDSLTKLLNKDAGRRQAEEYLEQYAQGVECAMLIIDLDHFKTVNDRFGHLFGDSVLTRAAREIRKLFRAQDIVARIGGDEFMVLMRGAAGRPLVEARCQRLLNAFRAAFLEMSGDIPISCSIGAALGPQHGSTYVELFRRADQALYRAKFRGRNAYEIFNEKDILLPAAGHRATAVSDHIDSDDHPALTDMGIVQYTFRWLYAARDMDGAIQELLALVGQQINVSRVYIFENSPDNRFCSNTYEWCAEGISPEKDLLQNVRYETEIPGYENNFDEDGIFYCPDIRVLPQRTVEILQAQGIRSVLQCAIREEGVFRGYIGFDDCRDYRLWTQEQIDLLIQFSDTLSVFLLKKRARERMESRTRDLHRILDHQRAWIYIVDPGTHRLVYLNASVDQGTLDRKEEVLCYRRLKGRNTPCDHCPLSRLKEGGETCVTQTLHQDNRLVLAEATRISWEDMPACMLTWRILDPPEK